MTTSAIARAWRARRHVLRCSPAAPPPFAPALTVRNARASVLIESEPKLQIVVLTRFLPQISLRNLRKPDCDANRYPLRSKTLCQTFAISRKCRPARSSVSTIHASGSKRSSLARRSSTDCSGTGCGEAGANSRSDGRLSS